MRRERRRARAHAADARPLAPAPNLRAVVTAALLSRAFVVALVVAACGALTPASAATFDDYRARVRKAGGLIEQLLETVDPDEWVTEQDRARAEAATVGELRAVLPARERVERAGGAVEVDNGWLHKELDAYAALGPGKVKEKEKSAGVIGERLAVLDERLEEEARDAATSRDKEDEKGRLQSILRRPEYNEEASKGDALQRLMQWLADLLKKLMPERQPMRSGTANFLSIVARLFVYALAVGVIVFLVWRYGPYLWARFGTGRRGGRVREARVVLGERLAPDQSASDLIDEAERLARAGDLRGAIRKAYIAVLCELGDRHIIRLAQHKTNRDYLMSVRAHADLYGTMRPLTTVFERHWYGFAPATDADWAEYRALCNRALAG